MADFPGIASRPFIQPAIKDQTSAQASAMRQENHGLRALPSAKLPFGQGASIGIIH